VSSINHILATFVRKRPASDPAESPAEAQAREAEAKEARDYAELERKASREYTEEWFDEYQADAKEKQAKFLQANPSNRNSVNHLQPTAVPAKPLSECFTYTKHEMKVLDERSEGWRDPYGIVESWEDGVWQQQPIHATLEGTLGVIFPSQAPRERRLLSAYDYLHYLIERNLHAALRFAGKLKNEISDLLVVLDGRLFKKLVDQMQWLMKVNRQFILDAQIRLQYDMTDWYQKADADEEKKEKEPEKKRRRNKKPDPDYLQRSLFFVNGKERDSPEESLALSIAICLLAVWQMGWSPLPARHLCAGYFCNPNPKPPLDHQIPNKESILALISLYNDSATESTFCAVDKSLKQLAQQLGMSGATCDLPQHMRYAPYDCQSTYADALKRVDAEFPRWYEACEKKHKYWVEQDQQGVFGQGRGRSVTDGHMTRHKDRLLALFHLLCGAFQSVFVFHGPRKWIDDPCSFSWIPWIVFRFIRNGWFPDGKGKKRKESLYVYPATAPCDPTVLKESEYVTSTMWVEIQNEFRTAVAPTLEEGKNGERVRRLLVGYIDDHPSPEWPDLKALLQNKALYGKPTSAQKPEDVKNVFDLFDSFRHDAIPKKGGNKGFFITPAPADKYGAFYIWFMLHDHSTRPASSSSSSSSSSQ